MFNNVSLEESLKIDLDDGIGGQFPQKVPIPTVDGSQIVTKTGYDCPIARDISFQSAEENGLGEARYYVVGRDVELDCPLVSLKGHLGSILNNAFSGRVTENLYYNARKMPWDLQKTIFHYFDSVAQLTGTNLKKGFLDTFDEDEDGEVSYEESGSRGISCARLYQVGLTSSIIGKEQLGYLRGPFGQAARRIKWSDPKWNPEKHDLFEETIYPTTCWTAYKMSQKEIESPDPYIPGLTWGKGKWPSFQLARHITLGTVIYGGRFPDNVAFESLYGWALLYAELTQNEGRYTPDTIERYITDLREGRERPLDFTFYVPEGYDTLNGSKMPNVRVTDDPNLILTAHFSASSEIWPCGPPIF
jgi:hypothetical protein